MMRAPAKADIAVVLAGDPHGHRILKAAELVKAGYVRKAMVSGPSGMYGVYENDLAIPFAVRHGYPLEWFVPLPNSATSTAEEAVVVIQELRRRNIHSFILVTSDYHTARAARIFRATCRSMGGGLEMRVMASPDEDFHVSDWWHNRLGQKTVFLEWCKTIATALGV